jgi:CelD/BcsL family acetyltransferase involved in cellulose biosynthesis
MNALGVIATGTVEGDFALSPSVPAGCAVRIFSADDPALAAAWDALAVEASEPNPFAERWYLAAAIEVLGEAASVVFVTVWDGGLIGMLPLQRQPRYAGLPVGHVQNWLNHNAFLGTPMVRKGAEVAFWQALLRYLDGESKGALFLHLTDMATEGPIIAALEQVCRAGNRRHALVHHEERALLERGVSPTEYLEANVRGKKRKELRRQQNRLAEEGTLAFARTDGSAGLEAWIDEFLALERRGWKGENGSALDCADGTRQLFRHALHDGAKAGKLELLDLRLDGRAIAMLVNFLTPPGAFSFKTAFDEDYARFSPGVLLQIDNLALLERDGIDWCDSCAAQDHPMIDSLWSGRRSIGRYSVAIGGKRKRAAFALLLAAEKAKARFKGRAVT